MGADTAGDTVPRLGPHHARPPAHRLSSARAGVLQMLIGVGDVVTVSVLAERLGQHPNTVREHLDALVAAGRVERLRSEPIGRGRPAWLYRSVGPAGSASAARTGPGIGGFDAGEEEYAALAVALIDQVVSASPDPRGMARQAGERWGRTLIEHRRDHGAAGGGDGGHGNAGDGGREDSGDGGRCGGGDPAHRDGSAVAPCDPAGTVVDLLDDLRYEPQPPDRHGTVRLTACPLLDAARHNPDVVCEVHLGIVRGALDRLGGDPDGASLVPFAEPGACLLTLPGRR